MRVPGGCCPFLAVEDAANGKCWPQCPAHLPGPDPALPPLLHPCPPTAPGSQIWTGAAAPETAGEGLWLWELGGCPWGVHFAFGLSWSTWVWLGEGGEGLGTGQGGCGSARAAAFLPINLLPIPASSQEGTGGQSAPAEPQASAVDTLHGASSALGPKEPWTQPAPSTTKGSPQKWAGAPSDQARTSDGSTTSPGTQPESPGIQATLAGVQPEASSTQTASLEMQPALQGTQGRGADVQPGPLCTDPSPQSATEVSPEATGFAQGMQVDAAGPVAAPSMQPARVGQPAPETSWATAQGLEMPLNVVSPLQEPAMGSHSDHSVDTAEALRQVGQLGLLYTSPKEQVAQLEATKAGHGEVEKLSLLFLKEGGSPGRAGGEHLAWGQPGSGACCGARLAPRARPHSLRACPLGSHPSRQGEHQQHPGRPPGPEVLPAGAGW